MNVRPHGKVFFCIEGGCALAICVALHIPETGFWELFGEAMCPHLDVFGSRRIVARGVIDP